MGIKKHLMSGGHCVISMEVPLGINFPLPKAVTGNHLDWSDWDWNQPDLADADEVFKIQEMK